MSRNIPAYPSTEWSLPDKDITKQHTGMTLRDYFAAKAMQSHMETFPENNKVNDGYIAQTDFHLIAEWSYLMADAMMKARGNR